MSQHPKHSAVNNTLRASFSTKCLDPRRANCEENEVQSVRLGDFDCLGQAFAAIFEEFGSRPALGFRPHPRVVLPAQQRAASAKQIIASLTTDSVEGLYAAAPFSLEPDGGDILISFKQSGVVAARAVLVNEDTRTTFIAEIASKGDVHTGAVQRFSLSAEDIIAGTWRLKWEPPFEWMSYTQLAHHVQETAFGLVQLLPPGSKVGICGRNSLEWIVMDLACMWAGMVSVPMSAEWDQHVMGHVWQSCGLAAVAVDSASLSAVQQACSSMDGDGGLKVMVEMNNETLPPEPAPATNHVSTGAAPSSSSLSSPPASAAGPTLLQAAELRRHGRLKNPVERGHGALHTIIHTSGSTGMPKGVVYSDGLWLRNLVHYPAAETVGFSYMPLCYITDRHSIATILYNGGRIGICEPQLHAHPNPEGHWMKAREGGLSAEDIFTDLQCVRPTVLKAVPKFLEEVSLSARKMHDRRLLIFGGRVHTLVSGAGGLTKEVASFFRRCRQSNGQKVALVEGYGATETGNLAINGKMLAHVQWELRPVDGFNMAEGKGELCVKTGQWMFNGYFNDQGAVVCQHIESIQPNIARVLARGHGRNAGDMIMVRVGSVIGGSEGERGAKRAMEGQPVKVLEVKSEDELLVEVHVEGEAAVGAELCGVQTTSSFDDRGFYRMGDVVRLRSEADGTYVEVLGRTKGAAKLSTGKWVLPERLEDVYRQAEGVRYVMIYGSNRHAELAALIDPQDSSASSAALSEGGDVACSLRAEHSKQRLLLALQECARQAGLEPFETVQTVVVATQHWCSSAVPQTLNGTSKLHRRNLLELYQPELHAALDALKEKNNLPPPLHGMDPSKGFKANGGSSLQAQRIAALYRELGIPVEKTLERLLSHRQPPLSSLPPYPPPDPSSIRLPPGIQKQGRPAEGGRVFVTGGTGFIGRYVVHELLKQGAKVTCLVRGKSEEDATHRLRSALLSVAEHGAGGERKELKGGKRERERERDVERAMEEGRLEAVAGELDKAQLGLSEARLREVVGGTARIVHLGAVVQLGKAYAAHHAANVEGTLNVLRLAFLSGGARTLFASTTDVLPSDLVLTPPAPPLSDGSDPPLPSQIPLPDSAGGDGYGLSKLVGERLLEEAWDRGLDGVVCRLGLVGGHSVSGENVATDFLSRLLIGFAHTQAFPLTPPLTPAPRFLPVDLAARLLVAILLLPAPSSSSPEPGRRMWHVTCNADDLSMPQLRATLERFGGPFKADEMQSLEFRQWMKRAEVEGSASVWPVLYWAAHHSSFPMLNRRSVRPPEWMRDACGGAGRELMGATAQDSAACILAMLQHLSESGALPKGEKEKEVEEEDGEGGSRL